MAAVATAKAAVLAASGHAKEAAPVYHKSASIGILAAKAIEQTGEHGSVFALAEHLDVDVITAMVVGLIIFTILFEVAIHKLEHYLSSNHIYLECLLKVFKELTIMGFISFILLLVHEFVKVPFHEHLCFEFAHIWIFFVALCFILHSIIFMASLSSSEKKFKVYDSTKHENAVLEEPTIRHSLVGLNEAESVLSYHVAKEIFREHNNVKPSFDFRKYISSFCGETIVELLDTTELTWGLIIVLFLLNLGRNHMVDYMNGTTENYAADVAAADKKGSLLELSTMPHSHHVSFFQLSNSQVEELLGSLGAHKRNIWTFMTFGWFIFVSNFLCLVWARHISNRLIYDARLQIGREEGAEVPDEAREWDEKKMRSKLPCGKMMFFTVTLELITMVQCFYLGLLLLLNARTAYTNYAPPFGFLFMVAMFVPVFANLFIIYPAQLKTIAFLSALTNVNNHLKHEVEEYQHGMLVDFHHKVKTWLHKVGMTSEQAAAEVFNSCKNENDEVTAKALDLYLKAKVFETGKTDADGNVIMDPRITFKADQMFVVFKQIDEDDSGVIDQTELVHMFSASAKVHDEETGKH